MRVCVCVCVCACVQAFVCFRQCAPHLFAFFMCVWFASEFDTFDFSTEHASWLCAWSSCRNLLPASWAWRMLMPSKKRQPKVWLCGCTRVCATVAFVALVSPFVFFVPFLLWLFGLTPFCVLCVCVCCVCALCVCVCVLCALCVCTLCVLCMCVCVCVWCGCH